MMLAMLLLMPPHLVMANMQNCRAMQGEPVAVFQLYKHGRYSSPVDTEGVREIHCYLPNGNVKIFTVEVPVTVKSVSPDHASKRAPALIDKLRKP